MRKLVFLILAAVLCALVCLCFLPQQEKTLLHCSEDDHSLELRQSASLFGKERRALILTKRGRTIAEQDMGEVSDAQIRDYRVQWLYNTVQVLTNAPNERTYVMSYKGDSAVLQGDSGKAMPCGFDIESFVEGYNSVAAAYMGDALPAGAESGWSETSSPSLLNGERVLRCAHKLDNSNSLEPELVLYLKEGSGLVELVAIGFENHGYTEWGTRLSKERSFFSLKTLLGNRRDSQIWEIYEKIYAPVHRAENFSPSGERPQIPRMHVFGGLGMFSYFSGGISWLCLCPVDDAQLEHFESRGCELIYMDSAAP